MDMESFALLVFLLQQLGIALGVGASTFALMFYIVGISDGVIDASEKRFMHAVYTTLRLSLFLIIVTGILITGAHYFAGEIATITAPSYLFKWILLLCIVVNASLMDLRMLPPHIGGAIAGASWYALFVLHTLSLSLSWGLLFAVYVAWLIIFYVGFTLLQKFAQSLYVKEGSIRVPQPIPSSSSPKIENSN